MVTGWMQRAVVSFVLVLAAAAVAGAQPLGTFRWQQQPYCNLLTLNVVQSGGIYHLDGYDDQCGGAAPRAAVVGIAFLNPDGSVGIGLTLVTAPGGTPLHIDVALNLATIGGTWRDSAGNTGPFILTPGAGIAGSPRPAPRVLFPAGLSVGGTTITNLAPPVAPSDAATKAYVDAALPRPVRADRPFHVFVVCAASTRFAVVAANGTFARGSAGTTSLRSTVGTYQVRFDIDVSACSWQVTVGQTGSSGDTTGVGNVAGRVLDANGLFITTYDVP